MQLSITALEQKITLLLLFFENVIKLCDDTIHLRLGKFQYFQPFLKNIDHIRCQIYLSGDILKDSLA